jgi:uracil-DNA glycosylase family 4
MPLDDILKDLADFLEYQLEEGQTVTELDPAVLETLSRSVPVMGSQPEDTISADALSHAADTARPTSTNVLEGLAQISTRIAQCRQCTLCEARTNTVPGQGSPTPAIAFVGEGPGADEDQQGLAFVGRAGKLLTKMIEAMGLTRDEVWIGNIVKCRPPGNRAPLPDEMEACLPYLKEQLALLQPRVIVCLGATAVKGLLETKTGITKLRGNWRSFEGIDVMPTFHPAYLLRNPPAKKDVWEDLKDVLRHLGRPIPEMKKR